MAVFCSPRCQELHDQMHGASTGSASEPPRIGPVSLAGYLPSTFITGRVVEVAPPPSRTRAPQATRVSPYPGENPGGEE